MDAASATKLFLFAILLVISGFFSGSESALFSLGLYRVRRLKNYAQRSYLAAQQLLQVPTRLISTLLTGNEFSNAAISVVGSSLVYGFFQGRVSDETLPLLAVGAILPFVLIFGEIVPKTLGVKHPERFVAVTALPLLWFSNAVAPIRDFLAWLSNRALQFAGQPPVNFQRVSEEVFRTLVDTGKKEGVVDAQEQQLIHNVFNLDDVHIAQIMTPVDQVSHMTLGMTVREAMKQIDADRYSRFPVLDRDEKKVIGTLYTKDLLGLPVSTYKDSIESLVRPPLLVSPDVTALALFARFRSKRTHFGVVQKGETDGMMGVVTLEDILEEIFGDIRDERDVEEASPSKLS